MLIMGPRFNPTAESPPSIKKPNTTDSKFLLGIFTVIFPVKYPNKQEIAVESIGMRKIEIKKHKNVTNVNLKNIPYATPIGKNIIVLYTKFKVYNASIRLSKIAEGCIGILNSKSLSFESNKYDCAANTVPINENTVDDMNPNGKNSQRHFFMCI